MAQTAQDQVQDMIERASRLGDDVLASEIRAFAASRQFGLVFEHNRPERMRLYGKPISIGDVVQILSERGKAEDAASKLLWRVESIAGATAELSAYKTQSYTKNDGESCSVELKDLVAVAEYDQPIYAGLHETGRVERGGDKPYQVVINGENYHALESLLFCYAGKVDCIYIDPLYNTGARDWKYNNDYVDGSDAYRHSKWLAMMERRLKLAKKLLNPAESVLICTIDEKEYLRLGMLLEQLFLEARIQMITCVISSQGSTRDGLFSRADEYIYFVFLGDAEVVKSDDDMLNEGLSSTKSQLWFQFVRTGKGNLRENSKNLFYPIFINAEDGRIVQIGEPIPLGVAKETVEVPDGLVAIWPMTADGREARWRTGVEVANRRLSRGLLRLGKTSKKAIGYSVLTVNEGTENRIDAGEIEIVGYNKDGSANLREKANGQLRAAKTVWNKTSHNAGWHGSKLLGSILPNHKFPYPKSLYAVQDTLQTIVGEKPNALIMDFFSGSGTTAHAVMRLNHQDGGRRRCICVTNNEVSEEEEKRLTKQGYRKGDPEWEQLGICEYVTKPRVEAAITGRTPEGEPIKGDYKFTDEFPMADGFEENAIFFDLTYQNPDTVELGAAFKEIAPLLWLRAGAHGSMIEHEEPGYAVADAYAVLFDYSYVRDFIELVRSIPNLVCAYIVTDDPARFASAKAELGDMECVRLYESYLRSFKIAAEDAVR